MRQSFAKCPRALATYLSLAVEIHQVPPLEVVTPANSYVSTPIINTSKTRRTKCKPTTTHQNHNNISLSISLLRCIQKQFGDRLVCMFQYHWCLFYRVSFIHQGIIINIPNAVLTSTSINSVACVNISQIAEVLRILLSCCCYYSTFGIHSHKTLDTVQPCHLLKPN